MLWLWPWCSSAFVSSAAFVFGGYSYLLLPGSYEVFANGHGAHMGSFLWCDRLVGAWGGRKQVRRAGPWRARVFSDAMRRGFPKVSSSASGHVRKVRLSGRAGICANLYDPMCTHTITSWQRDESAQPKLTPPAMAGQRDRSLIYVGIQSYLYEDPKRSVHPFWAASQRY